MSNEWEEVRCRNVVSSDQECPYMMTFYQEPGYEYEVRRKKVVQHSELKLAELKAGDLIQFDHGLQFIFCSWVDSYAPHVKMLGYQICESKLKYAAVMLGDFGKDYIEKVVRGGGVIYSRWS